VKRVRERRGDVLGAARSEATFEVPLRQHGAGGHEGSVKEEALRPRSKGKPPQNTYKFELLEARGGACRDGAPPQYFVGMTRREAPCDREEFVERQCRLSRCAEREAQRKKCLAAFEPQCPP
jgi:hypothetical protein